MDKRNNSASAKDITETQNSIQNLEVRVLRSRAAKKPPAGDSVDTLVKPTAKRIRRKRPTESGPEHELPKIHKQIKYFVNRISYHQTFLEAYTRKGWKNQSMEKIRPEKELERAKADIVWYKLRMREAFQNLHHLQTVGKPHESLFDSDGNISLHDIVCATCSLQEDTPNNDIIFCDGACDRGFHQNCLNPPLLTKDIPEEEWLCPACDCKIYCIELIKKFQETDLSINHSWEKVFPEAAALAHGPMQNDVPELPSDDSEDDDFNPNISEEHVAGRHMEGSSEEDGDEGSDCDDSNFVTSSDNSEHVKEKEKVDDLGLPSDDSEDDDYDPEAPDSDKYVKEKQDESDFTSDSEKDNGKESGAGSVVRQSNEFTPQTSQQSLHSLVNAQHAEVLLIHNGSSPTGQKRHYGPIINQVEKWFKNRRRHTRLASNKNSTRGENNSTKTMMVENPNLYRSDAVNEDTPSGIMDEGITQDGPLKQDIDGGTRTNAYPPNSSQRYTTGAHYVRCRKGESSRENHVKNTSSSSAGRPKGGDAEYAVLALEAVDEKRRNKMLQELKKRKIS